MATMTSGEHRLEYRRAGPSGDPVVLVHGGWDDLQMWDRVVPGLAGSLQVLVYDRCGHGRSSPRAPGDTVGPDARDLASLLEGTGLFPAHVVAHTGATAVAVRLAIDRPELVRSLAVHEAPYLALLEDDPASQAEGRRLASELERFRRLADAGEAAAAFEAYRERFGSVAAPTTALGDELARRSVPNARAWRQEMGDPEALRPPARELGSLALPVLATSGGRSPAFAARIHDLLVARLPNAQALQLPDAGHDAPLTEPDLYVGVLGTFLLERNVPST